MKQKEVMVDLGVLGMNKQINNTETLINRFKSMYNVDINYIQITDEDIIFNCSFDLEDKEYSFSGNFINAEHIYNTLNGWLKELYRAKGIKTVGE